MAQGIAAEGGRAMKWISSLSQNSNYEYAVQDCVASIQKGLGSKNVDFVAMFISPHFEKEYRKIHKMALERLNPKVLLGSSAGGIIGANQEVENRPAISFLAGTLPEVQIREFHVDDEDLPDLDSSPKNWQDLVNVDRLIESHFVLLADPFSIRLDNFVMGLDFAYPHSIKVGGLASGATAPGKNALFLNHEVFQSGLVGAAFSGNIGVEALVAQGCRPIGKKLKITGCDQNVLTELDGAPPLIVLEDLYQTLNERDKELAQHSLFLGIATDPAKGNLTAGDFLIRNILAADSKQGILAVGNILRVGQTVQFHLRDSQTSHEDLEEVLSKYASKRGLPSQQESSDTGVMLFSCIGRGSSLYQKPNHDTELFQKIVGQWPIAGFFCNGEIGPVGSTTYLHGYTSCFGLFHPKK